MNFIVLTYELGGPSTDMFKNLLQIGRTICHCICYYLVLDLCSPIYLKVCPSHTHSHAALPKRLVNNVAIDLVKHFY